MLRGAQASAERWARGREISGTYDQRDCLHWSQAGSHRKAGRSDRRSAEGARGSGASASSDGAWKRSLKFDPLTRQIEKTANGSGRSCPSIRSLGRSSPDQRELGPLEAAWATANDAVDKQQGAVDAAQAARRSIQAAFDAENGQPRHSRMRTVESPRQSEMSILH